MGKPNRMNGCGKRHYGPRYEKRTFSETQIAEMEFMKYQKRMSFAAIAEVFDADPSTIEMHLRQHGNFYGSSDGSLRAKPFDGWDFSGDNLPLLG